MTHSCPSIDADARDDARRGRLAVVHLPGRQRIELQKGRLGIAEQLDALARQQLVALAMLGDRFGAAPAARLGDALAQFGNGVGKVGVALTIGGALALDMAFQDGHCWQVSSLGIPSALRWLWRTGATPHRWHVARPLASIAPSQPARQASAARRGKSEPAVGAQ